METSYHHKKKVASKSGQEPKHEVRRKKSVLRFELLDIFLQAVKTGSFQTQNVDQVGKCDTFLNVTPCLAKNEPTGKASEFKKLVSHFKHRYFYEKSMKESNFDDILSHIRWAHTMARA